MGTHPKFYYVDPSLKPWDSLVHRSEHRPHHRSIHESSIVCWTYIFESEEYSISPPKYASGKSLHPRVSLRCPASRLPRKTLRKASLLKSLSSLSNVFAYSKQPIHPGKVMKHEYHMDHKSFAFWCKSACKLSWMDSLQRKTEPSAQEIYFPSTGCNLH